MKAFGVATFLLLTYATAWPTVAVSQVASRPSRAARPAPRVARPENRWRYVWHNDRWWYWTRENRWAYFDGREWRTYDPRRPPTDALALGYRKAPAFERPPTVPPRRPRASPIGGGELGPIESFELGESAFRRLDPAAGALSHGLDRGPSDTRALSSSPVAGKSDSLGGTDFGSRTGRGTATGGGGFGGPSGRSLGAGSAAGGASTPQ